MKNRIKELREARGWSMEELGRRVGIGKSGVNKWEKGVNQIKMDKLQKLAEIFEIPIYEIIDVSGNTVGSFEEDAEPYVAKNKNERIDLGNAEFLYTAKTIVLDQIGIVPGTTLVVNMDNDATEHMQSEDIVLAQLYDGMSAKTVLRQFIAPSLLITNSSSDNHPTINLRNEDAVIKGVVTSWHSHLRTKLQLKLSPPKK